MHLLPLVALIPLVFVLGTAAAEINGRCTGKDGVPGICVSTAKCISFGGEYVSSRCPGTPSDVKCCTKPSCGYGTGSCRWTSECDSGVTTCYLCPGNKDFKCCLPKPYEDDTSYPTPEFPTVGACKKQSVKGVKKIVAENPGKIREIICIKDCPCPDGSNHCCGLNVDLMSSNIRGIATASGRSIAEWVMNHKDELDLNHVIWGQKIWNPSRDSVKPWSEWREMEDRCSVTANHWDRVHVSFNEDKPPSKAATIVKFLVVLITIIIIIAWYHRRYK